MTNWARGDVAMVRLDDETEVRATRTANDDWVTPNGTRYDPALTARPLVVLDPENREQAERLLNAYWIERSGEPGVEAFPEYVDDMQAALRSLVTPPRPPEPAGRYAVVEDAAGEEWIKDGLEKDGACSGLWWCVDRARRVSSETWRANWDDFTPVRVLSEGVTA